MASEVKTNKVSPSTGTTLNVGDSGDTLALAVDDVTGFNVGSDAAGDVLYHDGTDYTRLAKPGTPAGEVLTFATSATAPSWVAASGGGFNSIQFITSGSWTRPSDITKVVVTLVGAGGSGGNGNPPTYWGASGGGGGVIKAVLDVSSIASSTLVIGAGGTGAGGDSTWTDGTNTLTATGGTAGTGGGGSWHGTGGAGGIPVVTAGSPLSHLLVSGGRGTNGTANGQTPGSPGLGWGTAVFDLGTTANQVVVGYGIAGYGRLTGSTAGTSGIIVVEEYK